MNSQINFISVLRSCACFMVVYLHCAGTFVAQIDDQFNWWSSTFIDVLTRCSVPIFVMITGALLGNNTDEYSVFIKKRISRIVVPLIIWGFIYILFYYFLKGDDYSIKKIVSVFISGPISFHLWYLYMIVGIYLFIPIINPWLQKASNKEIWIFLALWQLASFIYPLYEHKMKMEPGIDLVYFSGFIGYYVLGYAILHKRLLNQLSKNWSAVLFILATVFTYACILWMSSKGKSPVLFMHNYLYLNIAIAAVALFIFVQQLKINLRLTNFFALTGKLSFGIYLFHIIPLKLFFHYFPEPIIPIAFLDLLIPLVIIFSSSWLGIYVLSKIPYTNRILY